MLLLLATLAAFGLYQITGRSRLLQPLRDFLAPRVPLLHELIECAQCSGFWYGAALAAAFLYLGRLDAIDAILLPFTTSGTTLAASTLLDHVDDSPPRE